MMIRSKIPSLTLLICMLWSAGCGRSEKVEVATESEAAEQPPSLPADVAPAPNARPGKEGKDIEPVPSIAAGEKSGNKEPQPKPRSTPPRPGADTLELIETVLGKQSDEYQGNGYSDLTFDETKETLTGKKLLTGRMPNSEFFGMKGNREVLFAPNGDLVGMAFLYSEGDNERSSAKLIDLFGKPEPENVEKFATEGSTRSSSILRVTYHCPNVVVVIRYVFESSIEFNSVRKTQRTFLGIYDRRWIVQELAGHIEHQRDAMEWFTKVVDAGRPPGTELGKLPSWPETTIEEKTSAIWSGFYWMPTKSKEGEAEKNPRNPPVPNWLAALTTQAGKTPEHPKDTVSATLRVPSERRTLLEKSNLAYMLTRANSALAQVSFPPRGDSITVKSMGTAKSFEWLTKDYLIVQVKADNTLVVARRPN
jgi:hypothetical protein